jgi:type I restriction enzyme S subunit
MKYKLSDICTITKGETGIMKAIPGKYTMITLGEDNKTHNEFQFDAKAVIVPLISSTGHGHKSMKRVKYYEGKFALGNILSAVIPKDETKVNAKYLHIYLHENRDRLLVPLMKGAANVSLPITRLENVEVIIPAIKRQLEIVELEKTISNKNNQLENLFTTQTQLLSKLRQSILQSAIQGKLTAAWREQNPNTESAAELLKRIKAEGVKAGKHESAKRKKEKSFAPVAENEVPFELPDGWVWCRFLDLVTYNKGKKPSSLLANSEKDFTIPYIDIAAFEKNKISNYTNDKKAVFCDIENILMVWDGARMGLVGKGVKGAVGSTLIKIEVIECAVDYIFILLQSYFSFFNSNPKQAGLPHMNGELLDNLVIALPPLAEQQAIVSKVEALMGKCSQLQGEIECLRGHSKELLKVLFSEVFEGER